MTTAQTQLAGVLGWPVRHSRSPAIHSAAIEALGLDAVYLAFEVRPEQLGEAIAGLRALGAVGVNLTLPHKVRVIPFLDDVDPAARAIGAVNTIVREGDALVGTNTDAAGLARSLEQAGISLRGARVLVIGAGGAARAAVAGLSEAGAASVTVAARRAPRADAVAKELKVVGSGATIRGIDLRDAHEVAADVDLLVQATSATLSDDARGDAKDRTEADRFAASLPIDRLPAHAAVVDLVYSPLETAVLRTAARRGLRTVDGLGMLVWQAALAFERWFGVAPPVEVMREAALRSEARDQTELVS